MPYPNEHSCRLLPPGKNEDYQWARVSRRTSDTRKEYKVIRRKKKQDGEWEDQAFRYSKARWDTDEARAHCRSHDGTFEAAEPQANKGEMTLDINTITNLITIPLREEIFEGRKHLVVPVVALVEGVHYGSGAPGGAVFYPAEEIAKYIEAWSGIPVPVHHPQINGEYVSANSPEIIEQWSVGRFFNPYFDENGGKLKGEIWIDIEKAQRLSPEILTIIRSGDKLEISTALWHDNDFVSGTWCGEEYITTARNYRPDSIALLPGGEGACSWVDGCGVRINKNEKGGKGDMKSDKKQDGELAAQEKSWTEQIRTKFQGWFQQLSSYLELKNNELSHDDIRSMIQKTLDSMDNSSWIHFLKEVYDDSFIYESRGNNPSETGIAGGVSKLYQRGYSVDAEGKVTLKDDAKEVKEERRYVPVTNEPAANIDPQKEKIKQEEVKSMEKNELIGVLIACDKTRFKEEDKEWLNSLSLEQLEKLKPADPLPPAPVINQPAVKPEPKKPVTVDEFIANAPPEIKSVLTRAIDRDRQVKDQILKGILANVNNSFSEDQLKAKEIGELEQLATLARIEVDFSAQAGSSPRTNEDAVPPMPPVFDLSGKK